MKSWKRHECWHYAMYLVWGWWWWFEEVSLGLTSGVVRCVEITTQRRKGLSKFIILLREYFLLNILLLNFLRFFVVCHTSSVWFVYFLLLSSLSENHSLKIFRFKKTMWMKEAKLTTDGRTDKSSRSLAGWLVNDTYRIVSYRLVIV